MAEAPREIFGDDGGRQRAAWAARRERAHAVLHLLREHRRPLDEVRGESECAAQSPQGGGDCLDARLGDLGGGQPRAREARRLERLVRRSEEDVDGAEAVRRVQRRLHERVAHLRLRALQVAHLALERGDGVAGAPVGRAHAAGAPLGIVGQ